MDSPGARKMKTPAFRGRSNNGGGAWLIPSALARVLRPKPPARASRALHDMGMGQSATLKRRADGNPRDHRRRTPCTVDDASIPVVVCAVPAMAVMAVLVREAGVGLEAASLIAAVT